MDLTMPKVLDCSMQNCAYNKNTLCHAMAITIGDTASNPACDTFIETAAHDGGFPNVIASVGACRASDCRHNEHLECMADNVRVVNNPQSPPSCSTFNLR